MLSVYIITAILLTAGSADAATITSNALINPIVQDFSDGDDVLRGTFTDGPEDASAGGVTVTWTSTSSRSVFSGFVDSFGLGGNGFWFADDDNRDGFVGINPETASMTFSFETPVSGVGGFVNYAVFDNGPVGNDPIIEIFDADGNSLETFNLFDEAPILTPNQNNAGAFRGFIRPHADIVSFALSGSFILLDDLTFSTESSAVVPLPGALPLMLAGLAGLGLVARRRG
ncbi:MAG: VPLPA-CTERM sorting domain-containing protein [Pikeienuella sp.]